MDSLVNAPEFVPLFYNHYDGPESENLATQTIGDKMDTRMSLKETAYPRTPSTLVDGHFKVYSLWHANCSVCDDLLSKDEQEHFFMRLGCMIQSFQHCDCLMGDILLRWLEQHGISAEDDEQFSYMSILGIFDSKVQQNAKQFGLSDAETEAILRDTTYLKNYLTDIHGSTDLTALHNMTIDKTEEVIEAMARICRILGETESAKKMESHFYRLDTNEEYQLLDGIGVIVNMKRVNGNNLQQLQFTKLARYMAHPPPKSSIDDFSFGNFGDDEDESETPQDLPSDEYEQSLSHHFPLSYDNEDLYFYNFVEENESKSTENSSLNDFQQSLSHHIPINYHHQPYGFPHYQLHPYVYPYQYLIPVAYPL